MNKRIVAFIISIIILLSNIAPVWADIQDYRGVDFEDGSGMSVNKPTAQFSVTHNGTTYESPEGNDINSNAVVIEAVVGDVVTVADLSHSNRGKALKAWDFQYTRPDGRNEFFTNKAFEKSYTLDKPGTYTFSLCVRDNIENEAWTFYWGNWSENGNHRVIGNNPGQDAGDPSDDFNGYWYFTRIVVEVERNPPTADFKIYYKGKDVTDNKNKAAEIDPGDMSLVIEDESTPFSATEPITGRKWSYWDINNGWKEISGSANKTTVNISHMDSSLPGSGINKAFKLDVTSSTGGADDEAHTAYFTKTITTNYGYIIYYKDVDTDRDIAMPKVVEVASAGTYTEAAVAAPANGKLITPSPQDIVLTPASPKAEFTFYYKFTTPPPEPSTYPPSAILKTPNTVVVGDTFKADGSDSWSNNPGGYIADWDFEYEGANLEKDNGSNVMIWYPYTGTFPVYLEVDDENGDTDSMENEIEVIPPTPKAVITVTGNLKENRKVTLSGLNSSSGSDRFDIVWSECVWHITPASSSITVNDIKTLAPHTIENNSLKVVGVSSLDILSKKYGKLNIKLDIVTKPNWNNTYGRPASANQTITIAKDLPPIAECVLPTPEGVEYTIYRDPEDSNYATAEIFNESYSPDGDIINKAVALYCYDSDNDGDYKDEQWYYSKDGTTWQSTGLNYANTVSSFNIYNIATSNVRKFTHKSKEVGLFWYVIRVMETIPASETIPEFITESDYKRADTF